MTRIIVRFADKPYREHTPHMTTTTSPLLQSDPPLIGVPDRTGKAIAEQRRGQRCQVVLPIFVTKIGGSLADLPGQTQNIGEGGVRFVVQNKLVIGEAIEYVLTLSSFAPVVAIRCSGKVLRCSKKQGQDSYDVAATMERYFFNRQQ